MDTSRKYLRVKRCPVISCHSIISGETSQHQESVPVTLHESNGHSYLKISEFTIILALDLSDFLSVQINKTIKLDV